MDEFLADDAPAMEFEQTAFDHPVYIMYSSGTTGVPKCIVHGAGGTLIQHLKELMLHCDLSRDDNIFYFTTCGWMMWNWLVSSLAVGATLVLYDGNPFHPGPEVLWKMAQDQGVTIFGTSARYLAALEKSGLRSGGEFDLSDLKAILSTGSPLAPEQFEWVYEAIKGDLCLSSISGGTDIISCFAGGNPIAPVYAGQLQAPGLGMAVQAWSFDGKPVWGQKGELVCVKAFPSMPVYFWNDEDGAKYRAAYFDRFENIWHHGDFCEMTPQGGVIIYGRSDATLNPGGVRIGTAEIYRQVEAMSEIADSLVVGQQVAGRRAGCLICENGRRQGLGRGDGRQDQVNHPGQHHAASRAGPHRGRGRHPLHHQRQEGGDGRAQGDPRPAGFEQGRPGQSPGPGSLRRRASVTELTYDFLHLGPSLARGAAPRTK